MTDAHHPRTLVTVAQATLPILASVLLLTLAAAPFGQWYLAWFALTPWLVAVDRAPTIRAAMLLGWLSGVLYFAANLWWLWTASIPGTILLVAYFGLFWSVAAGLIRSVQRTTNFGEFQQLIVVYRIFAIAVIWVATEWLRCNLNSGLPWMPLGCTQTPFVLMCQVADFGGPYAVSFWLALTNALFATIWWGRRSPAQWRAASVVVAVTLVAVAIYGTWRISSTSPLPGPRMMVVQSNFPHLPGGAPTVEPPQAVDYFLKELRKNLAEQAADMVVLPEAALPPINDDARRELARAPVGPFLESTYRQLMQIAKEHHTTLLVGGTAVTGWSIHGREHIGSEIRNSAYFFDPIADPPVVRYDKIYLARFSERAPLTVGPDWLRRFAMFISAPRAVQPMFAGDLRDLRPFRLRSAESNTGTPFITPICLENIDPATMAQMIRGPEPSGKQADFVANISNDGWFGVQEKYQHLQTTVLRCIENRIPMVRCSNTGISAFIDSIGRVHASVGPNTAGHVVSRIELDSRRTFYTRFGDLFSIACVMIVAAATAIRVLAKMRAQNHATSTQKREILGG